MKYETNNSFYEYENGVLRNKFDIKDQSKLEELERKIVAINTSTFNTKSRRFDLKYLCLIHKHLFNDIFKWAGKIRKVDISKGNTRFANFQFIEESWNLYVAPKVKNLADSNDKIRVLAEILCEINIIHPFREGNGRSSRIFIKELAEINDIKLMWSNVSEKENLDASVASVNDIEPMITLLKKCMV